MGIVCRRIAHTFSARALTLQQTTEFQTSTFSSYCNVTKSFFTQGCLNSGFVWERVNLQKEIDRVVDSNLRPRPIPPPPHPHPQPRYPILSVTGLADGLDDFTLYTAFLSGVFPPLTSAEACEKK